MENKILVASVHAPCQAGLEWYRLQKRYVEQNTTGDFDYKIVLNGVDPAGFDPDDILRVNAENIGHAPALRQLLDHFRTTDHDAYLILDSDCFPIWWQWERVLLGQMAEHEKLFAAPIRAENLDTFPHPCAFFIRREGLDHPRLNFDEGETWNLLGKEFEEVGGRLQGSHDIVLPMVRTNVINLHPLAAGIYHHLFYHHQAGSRRFHCRVTSKYYYYTHWLQQNRQVDLVQELQERLFRDPERFTQYLMGYSEPTMRKLLRRCPPGPARRLFRALVPQRVRDLLKGWLTHARLLGA